MIRLNDDMLLESYQKAFKLNLNKGFLLLLLQEINRRGIQDLLNRQKKLINKLKPIPSYENREKSVNLLKGL
ncbi:sporulation histidine kinase inhibitor Sda (plasmid) [Alkalihalophilus pseudofirmus]|uniref:sporulation histidine kinase inhibitor Sda n=1 Tax=Alkalihalophilus pseudofirmus TaxID=79885 RepID=UPI00259B5FB2|nr:sporulation histidine kinase inhibitor Sda [Alkalihalophilus pseudofirmus]WEG19190.1 sporulation histidine kinase inhibitor Sda [Alkalihalophilus pseudofirmus]